MRIPQGVTSPSKKFVCRLRKSLYGLKKAPRAWFETFRRRLWTSGFTQSPYDPSLSLQNTSTGITVLLMYVDDIIITGIDDGIIKSIEASLRDSFHMKDFSPTLFFWAQKCINLPNACFLINTNTHQILSSLLISMNLHPLIGL